MQAVITSVARFAKNIRTFLGLAVFIVFVLLVAFIWSFSNGSFDTALGNLSPEHTFYLFFAGLSAVFILLFMVTILSFFATKPEAEAAIGLPLYVVVHLEGDRTMYIEAATVNLSLAPRPQTSKTDATGATIFHFPKSLRGKSIEINAFHSEYEKRGPEKVKLQENKQVFLSLAPSQRAKRHVLFVKMVELQEEANRQYQQVKRYGLLDTPRVWNEVRYGTWFNEEVLDQSVQEIEDLYNCYESYSQLFRTRGNGHKIEEWVKATNVDSIYYSASKKFDSILRSLTETD